MILRLSSKIILIAVVFLGFTNSVSAHCDSIEGPVVKAAKQALSDGNINHVLVWVFAEDEAEIKQLFDKVKEVRNMNDKVRELADSYFFETVVRVHRMGEGVGYTGLKGADFKPEEGIEAADKAIENNSVAELLAHVDESEHEKVNHYFSDLQSKKNYDLNNVEAGREYVKSYVHFIHYVEGLFSGSMNLHEEHKH